MKKLLLALLAIVTAYTPHENNGRGTASGRDAREGRTVACDHLPFGTRVKINGHIYIVEDRFGGGYTNKFDIFMEDYDRAMEWGVKELEVEVIGMDDV